MENQGALFKCVSISPFLPSFLCSDVYSWTWFQLFSFMNLSVLLVCSLSQVSDGSLTVLSISREDRGAYTCRAYSPQGEAIHTTRLLVQGSPPHTDFSGCVFYVTPGPLFSASQVEVYSTGLYPAERENMLVLICRYVH